MTTNSQHSRSGDVHYNSPTSNTLQVLRTQGTIPERSYTLHIYDTNMLDFLNMTGSHPAIPLVCDNYGQVVHTRLPNSTIWWRPWVCDALSAAGKYKSSEVAEMGESGHNDMGWKEGSCCAPFVGKELGPHLTQCGLGRGLPPYQVASWSI